MLCDRSAGPTNRTSTPSIAARSSAAATASGDSTWNTPRSDSLTRAAMSGVVHRPVARPAGDERDAAHAGRRIAHPGHAVARLGGGADLRQHHPVRAEVQRAVDAQALHGRHADEGRGRRRLDGEQLGVEVGDRAHAVLEVEDRPVVAGPGDQLGGGGRPEAHEHADGRLAREDAAPEVASRRDATSVIRCVPGRRRPSGRRGRRCPRRRTTTRGRRPGRCGWARRRPCPRSPVAGRRRAPPSRGSR